MSLNVQNENNLLDKLFFKAEESPKYWNEYFEALMDSELVILVSQPISKDFSGEIPLLMISDNAGRQVIPLFTNKEHLKAIKGTFNVAEIKGIKLFKTLKNIPVVINPNTKMAKVLSPFEIKVITLEYLKKHEAM